MKKIALAVLLSLLVSTIWATTIYDIQYTTEPGPDDYYPSPLEGETVTVNGIVTAVGFKGYNDNIFISDPEGGAWKGIYVYMTGDTTLVTGDEIEVSALVTEYYGLTELTDVTNINLISSGNQIPDPVEITTDELASEEAYEGVLVELNDVVVTQAQNDYGEWYVVDTSGTPAQMDDGFFYLDSVTPPIVINVNDTWAMLRGVVNFSYDEYELNPRTPDDMSQEASAQNNLLAPSTEIISAYPNPFNPETTLRYQLSENDAVTINVYNIKGEKIRTLVDQNQAAGIHETVWTGKDDDDRSVSSGVYFFKLESAKNNADYTSTKKVILLK